jgi:ElaB/YqjD/DUF883 family membrane-anchored ribosome-binding protein
MPHNNLTSVAAEETLVANIKAVISDTEEILLATADQTGEQIVNLRVRVQARLDDARLRLAEIQADLVDRTKQVAQATDDYVHESPWTAIGIAAGVGVLAGLLLGRR